MGGICSCCDTLDINEPIVNIATAIDLDLDNDFGLKKKSKELELMNIACEINIFNEKQKSNKENINDLISNINKCDNNEESEEENKENKENDEKYINYENYDNDVNKTDDIENDKNDKNDKYNINLNIPRIVVVGTQTSGKSSLINRIIQLDLLPTGTNMVTRSPIYIELKGCDVDEIPCIKISFIKQGHEILFFSEKLALLKKEELTQKISELTFQMSGNEFSITKNPIILRIYQNNVIPLFIIDLPGLVTIARTEKGQKDTIINDIQNLVKEYLLVPNTYCITAIQAKLDLETDIGLALVKEIQKEKPDLKIFGALTKPDLLDKRSIAEFDEKIGTNSVDKNLLTEMGFYVVNNLVGDDSGWYENFLGKKSNILKGKKFGIKNLLVNCKKHVISGIFSEFSSIKKKLNYSKNKLVSLCPQLRAGIKDKHEKQLFIDSNLYILTKMISNSIDSVGINNNIGPQIKSTIEKNLNDIDKMDPFNETSMSDIELQNIINNFNGFTRSGQSKKALIVIRCLENKEKGPVYNISKKIKLITEMIKFYIEQFTKKTIDERYFEMSSVIPHKYPFDIKDFPKLREFILKSLKKILDKYEREVINLINKSLIIQEPSRNNVSNDKTYNMNIISINKNNTNINSDSNINLEFNDKANKFGDKSPEKYDKLNEKFGGDKIYGKFDDGLQGTASDTITEDNFKNKSMLGVSSTNTGILIEDINKKEEELTVKGIRELLMLSFKYISKIARENTIKEIETIQLKKFQEKLIYDIIHEFKNYYKSFEIDNLFIESDEMLERNKLCLDYINDIDKLLKMLDNFDK